MTDDPQPWATLQFPSIARTCYEIALDNDGINRERSAEQWAADYERFIRFIREDGWPVELLIEIDASLAALSDDDRQTLAAGEESEMIVVLAAASQRFRDHLDALLNMYFNEVC